MLVSLVICTRDRRDSLQATLQGLQAIVPPPGLEAELLIVDNGSSDGTAEMARAFVWQGGPARVVSESLPGLSRARNAALAAAAGSIIVFTDDDVRPPADWLQRLTEPIVSGAADAVAGGVRMASNLERPWFGAVHRLWLAESPADPGPHPVLIGANMAFSKAVLKKVPAFDPELGAGHLGYGEETLFSYQLNAAGFRLMSRYDVVVEHHFGADRISRAKFATAAANHGRSSAYIAHHWQHRVYRAPELQAARKRLMLKILHRGQREEITERELHDIRSFHLYSHYARIRTQPRNYEHHGLVKIRGAR